MRRPPARQLPKRTRAAAMRSLVCVLLAGLALAAGLQRNCKKHVNNYLVEYCGGYRGKRSLTYEPESAIKESRIRKRQAMTLSEIIMRSRLPVYEYHHAHGPGFIETVYVPVMPPTDTDEYDVEPNFEALPKEKNSDLGFDINVNELEELFEELSDRLPRSPNQEELKKIVRACCANNDSCDTLGSLINC